MDGEEPPADFDPQQPPEDGARPQRPADGEAPPDGTEPPAGGRGPGGGGGQVTAADLSETFALTDGGNFFTGVSPLETETSAETSAS